MIGLDWINLKKQQETPSDLRSTVWFLEEKNTVMGLNCPSSEWSNDGEFCRFERCSVDGFGYPLVYIFCIDFPGNRGSIPETNIFFAPEKEGIPKRKQSSSNHNFL